MDLVEISNKTFNPQMNEAAAMAAEFEGNATPAAVRETNMHCQVRVTREATNENRQPLLNTKLTSGFISSVGITEGHVCGLNPKILVEVKVRAIQSLLTGDLFNVSASCKYGGKCVLLRLCPSKG